MTQVNAPNPSALLNSTDDESDIGDCVNAYDDAIQVSLASAEPCLRSPDGNHEFQDHCGVTTCLWCGNEFEP
jgi:uncharacterized protein (UPF0212 family)